MTSRLRATLASSALAAAALLLAACSATPSASTPSSPSTAQSGIPWTYDYAQALGQARADNKVVFVLFTGSDWCPWCVKLNDEILATNEFIDWARDNAVLVYVDFPRSKELSAAQVSHNEALRGQFPVQGFPTAYIVRPDGQRLGEIGYMPGGPKAFLAELGNIVPARSGGGAARASE